METTDFDLALEAYLETALWSSTDDEGNSLDMDHGMHLDGARKDGEVYVLRQVQRALLKGESQTEVAELVEHLLEIALYRE